MSNKDLLPLARSLAAAGYSKQRIADAMKLPLRSIQRWAQNDEAEGLEWTAEPRPARHARGPNAAEPAAAIQYEKPTVVAQLKNRLAQLATLAPVTAKDHGHEHRMLDILKTIAALDEEAGPTVHLAAMNRFVTWALQQIPEQDMPVFRKHVRLYLQKLKADCDNT